MTRPTPSLALTLLLVAPASAQQLVADVDTAVVAPEGDLQGFVSFRRIDGRLFFSGRSAYQGEELYVDDGRGPVLFDLNPKQASSAPRDFAPVGDTIVFTARVSTGRELWSTDGTLAGTSQLFEVNPGPAGLDEDWSYLYGDFTSTRLVSLVDRAVFIASDGVHGQELWVTDGTAAGTGLLADLVPGPDGSGVRELTPLPNGSVLFSADGRLGRTDGTGAGTVWLTDSLPGAPTELTVLGDEALFVADDGTSGLELWSSDGTAAGTGLLVDLAASGGSVPRLLVEEDGLVYFATNASDAAGIAVWRTDGTAAGTEVFADSSPGGGVELLSDLAPVAGRLAYVRRVPREPFVTEVWLSDGTPAGTRRVLSIPLGIGETVQCLLTVRERTLVAVDWNLPPFVTYSLDLAGDVDVLPMKLGVPPQERSLVEDGVALVAAAARSGDLALWTTDGTPAGTQEEVVLVPKPETASSSPESLARVGDRVVFVANRQFFAGSDLLASDGSREGTVVLAETSDGFREDVLALETWALVFAAAPQPDIGASTNEEEPWATDGTPEGTFALADILPGPEKGPEVDAVAALGDQAFLIAEIGNFVDELWTSDGTPEGTRAVECSVEFLGLQLVRFLDRVWFVGTTGGIFGSEVLLAADADGPAEIVLQEYPGAGQDPLVVAGDRLFFGATTDGGLTGQVWAYDGVSDEPELLLERPGEFPALIGESDGRLLFWMFAVAPVASYDLWTTDGTPGGTTLLLESPVDSITGGGFDAGLAGGRFHFNGTVGGVSGLWTTDGDGPPVHLTSEVAVLGSDFGKPFQAVDSGGSVLFRADGPTGVEAWITDGTAEGTRPFFDTDGELGSSYPGGYERLGDQVLFAATVYETGRELYSFPFATTRGWIAEPFGSPCAAEDGRELWISYEGEARLGERFAVTLTGAEPGDEVVLSVGGLGSLAPEACEFAPNVLMFAFDHLTFAGASGEAEYRLQIPSSPSLVGLALAAQWQETGASVLSDALEIRVGP